jgi:hypothetical protein
MLCPRGMYCAADPNAPINPTGVCAVGKYSGLGQTACSPCGFPEVRFFAERTMNVFFSCFEFQIVMYILFC